MMLQKKASLVITDSGGLQKESFMHGTPCVTIRGETEWTELIDSGWNAIADPSKEESIISAISHQLDFDLWSLIE